MPARFIGIGYPVMRTSHGYLYKVQDLDAVKSDIIQLLLTEPGERVMVPAFGTGFRRMIFEQADEATLQELRDRIIAAINRWENRVVVNSLNVSFLDATNNPEDAHLIRVQIEFVLKDNLTDVETLSMVLSVGSQTLRS